MSKLSEPKLVDLLQATSYWLEYQAICGREPSFSERILAQPVCEFLASLSDKWQCEFSHPNFKDAKPGRPKQIDYVVLSKDLYVNTAIETKWIGGESDYKYSIVSDLLRLALMRDGIKEKNQSIERYFIIAGKSSDVDALFKKKARADGRTGKYVDFYSNVLPLKQMEELEVHIKDAKPFLERYFRLFASDYKMLESDISKAYIPNRFKVKFLKKIGVKESDGYAVYGWKISSIPNVGAAKMKTLTDKEERALEEEVAQDDTLENLGVANLDGSTLSEEQNED